MDAVELMVIDVETLSSGMPSNRRSMSASDEIATPARPTSPAAVSAWPSPRWPTWSGSSKAFRSRASPRR